MPAPTQIILRSAIVDPELKWTTPKQLIENLPRYLDGTLEGTEGLYLINYGFDTPAVDGQAYPWIRTDEDGRPMGTFLYYNGDWVRDWGLAINDIKPYTGDTADIPDGFTLCDGTLSTPNLGALAIAGAGPPDWDIHWIQWKGYA